MELSSGKKHFRAFRALYVIRRSIELQASGANYAEAMLEEPEWKMRDGVAACVRECRGKPSRALRLLSDYLPHKHRRRQQVRGVVSSGMHGTVLGLESRLYVIKLTLQSEETAREELEQQRRGYEMDIAVEPVELSTWDEPTRGARVCSILMRRVDGTLYDILRNAWEWSDSSEAVCRGLRDLFDRMAKAGFEHSDMHSENIGFLECGGSLRFVALDFDGSSFSEDGEARRGAHVSDLFHLLHDLSSQLSVVNDLYCVVGQEVLSYALSQKSRAGLSGKCPSEFSDAEQFQEAALRLSGAGSYTRDHER